MGGRKIDMTGQKFGRYTVLNDSGRRCRGEVLWTCRCECGNTREVRGANLRFGLSASCGCIRGTQSSSSKTPEYTAWKNIKQRCLNPNNPDWPDYGGRGIGICEKWSHDFSAFFRDAGQRPGPEYSIDRIDNSRGYEPGNIHWTTWVGQARNKRPRKQRAT